jgi:hypothetical protein
MWNGPADLIRRMHRMNPELSPKEIADEINRTSPKTRDTWRGKVEVKPLNPKYVSKILRRDGAELFKRGPKSEPAKGPISNHATPTAEKTKRQRKKKQKAPKSARPVKRRASGAHTGRSGAHKPAHRKVHGRGTPRRKRAVAKRHPARKKRAAKPARKR